MKKILVLLVILLLMASGCSEKSDDSQPRVFHVNLNMEDYTSGESLTASPADPSEGDTVTLRAVLNPGRQVDLMASGISFNPAANISRNGAAASFRMPDRDVTVRALFRDIPAAKEESASPDAPAAHKAGEASGAEVSPEGESESVQKPVAARQDSPPDSPEVESVPQSSEKAITRFIFEARNNRAYLDADVKGSIDETAHTITLTVPHGTSLKGLKPVMEISPDAKVRPASRKPNNFTAPVPYVVTAQDGSTQEYLVTVNVAQSSQKRITRFFLETGKNAASLAVDTEGIIDDQQRTVNLFVPYGTKVKNLTPSITVSPKARISPAGGRSGNFTKPVIYTVAAQDGSTQEYLVTVTVGPAAVENSGFGTPENVGDKGELTFAGSGERLTMLYANNSARRTFPVGKDDTETHTLTRKFWIAETEMTNAAVASVLQWAVDKGRFSKSASSPNGLSAGKVKYGSQVLLDLADSGGYCHVNYNASTGEFTVDRGYEKHPVVCLSWYGAVMLCNWLTEMRDGHTANLVYTGIDTVWNSRKTVEDRNKNGYRLPGSMEWEYAGRYRGTIGNLNAIEMGGLFYTKGNLASGATVPVGQYGMLEPAGETWDSLRQEASRVAVYKQWWDGAGWKDLDNMPTEAAVVKSLGLNSATNMGLYDMSGNVYEWCFTPSSSYRVSRGGCWGFSAYYLQVGYWGDYDPSFTSYDLGLRLCRTAD